MDDKIIASMTAITLLLFDKGGAKQHEKII